MVHLKFFPLNHDIFLLNINLFLFQSSSLVILQLSKAQLFCFGIKTLFFLFLWFLNKFHFLSKIFPNIFSGSFVLLVDLFSLTTNWSLKIGSVTKSGPTIPLTNRCWIWYWRYRCSWSFLRITPLWLVFQHEPTMFKLKESTIFIFI